MPRTDLDKKMRVFETAHDHSVVPGMYVIVRIDGRAFSTLTKEVHRFETPYDVKFRDMMVATTAHLMECGFKVVYGYTQSDEISLLLDPEDTTFQRKERKLISILAGEASAKFSLLLNDHAVFDARVSQLPNRQLVIDYFRWRQEDAHRNALHSHCFWSLVKAGEPPEKAHAQLAGLSVSAQNELLFTHGLNFNEIPNWHKRGVGVYWEHAEKPVSKISNRRLKTDYDLPMKDQYCTFIGALVPESAI